MKKMVLFAVIIIFLFVFASTYDKKREGVDPEFAQDALKIANEIDYWFNEHGLMYKEIPDDIKEMISDFDSEDYLDPNEKLSEKEEEILETVLLLETGYFFHGKDTDNEVKDNTSQINKDIRKIRSLTEETSQ